MHIDPCSCPGHCLRPVAAMASVPMPQPLCPPSVVCHPGPHLRRDTVVSNEEEGRVAVEGEIRHAGRRRLPRDNPPPPPLPSSSPSSSSSPLLIGRCGQGGVAAERVAAGWAGELHHAGRRARAELCRTMTLSRACTRWSSTKPALWETLLICVSHYAARTIPFAQSKPGYPLMQAIKQQRTALYKPG
jgi:hypothetical protein